MIGRIVEIASDNRYLSVSRGFLVVKDTSDEKKQLGKIPLDEIAALIANSNGMSYSNNLLVALAERGTPFVLCKSNHSTVGILWPIDGHHLQAKRFDAQIAASLPLRKRLWGGIVRSKLTQQESVLKCAGVTPHLLSKLRAKVRSGDPENIEAQGARYYWQALFGKQFRRDRARPGINSVLNYGYTVYRAATARAVIAAGLHPTLGIHHKNEGNPMRLVDDLMEPFRPIIDILTWRLAQKEQCEITPEIKTHLVKSLYCDMETKQGVGPVMNCIHELSNSLANVYLGKQTQLALPATMPVLEDY